METQTIPPVSSESGRSVGYNARAFTVNGTPELFLSAGIHYFRVPKALWADRIAKAKRGGMNTIETYVAWNGHEPAPGQFHFEDEYDLEAFLSECERQGMYVIVRPGPYICAEWDYGGFPAWLQTIPGIAFRTDNKPYLEAVDQWFDVLIPIIARHQFTKGGGVVLVQVENEYANLRWTRGNEMPTDDDYQRYLRDGLIRRGIDMPLITCVGPCAETVECINGHHPADQMPDFRKTYPDAPLFVTEFWTAWYDGWGSPHHVRSAADIEYASWRCWAEGAGGYNYYVYQGGTHFGYTPMYIQTTSYDYDAPLSETGRPTEKWRALRRVALFAHTFKDILTTGEHRVSKAGTNGLRVTEISNRERGSLLFVDNPDQQQTVTGSVFPYLPEITLGPRELFVYVHDVAVQDSGLRAQELGDRVIPNTQYPLRDGAVRYLASYVGLVKSEARVLTAHLRPDPFAGARVYVYGTVGETKEIVLFYGGGWGEGVNVTFADTPQVYVVGPSQVVALSTDHAGRTFFAESRVLIGPDDVREWTDDGAIVELIPGQEHTLYGLDAEGTIVPLTVNAPTLPAPPVLSEWQILPTVDYTTPDFDDSDWLELDEIATQGNFISLNIQTMGPEHGSNPYGWYRAVVNTEEAMDATLHFSACSDRLTLWHNGARVGSSPIPPEDRRTDWEASFDVRLVVGQNVFCVLADNLGLIKGDWQIGKGQEHEKKGIYGPVTLTPSGGCFTVDIARWKYKGEAGRREEARRKGRGEREEGIIGTQDSIPNTYLVTFVLTEPLDSATPLKLRLEGMGKGLFWLNGRAMGRYWVTARESQGKSGTVPEWLQKNGIQADTEGEWPQVEYYLPEPFLNMGENEIVLWETEGHLPERVSLVWDKNAAVVQTVTIQVIPKGIHRPGTNTGVSGKRS